MKENFDTYVEPQDSNALIAETLPASNPLRITWEVISDEEKAGYLSSALRKLENMSFVGQKVQFYQPLKFPRIARGNPPEFESAPVEVKRAQVLMAAEIMNEELYVKRRNTDACLALGLIKDPASSVVSQGVSVTVKELLHRWLTSWRRV